MVEQFFVVLRVAAISYVLIGRTATVWFMTLCFQIFTVNCPNNAAVTHFKGLFTNRTHKYDTTRVDLQSTVPKMSHLTNHVTPRDRNQNQKPTVFRRVSVCGIPLPRFQ
jgi:hypothetical protein